MDIVNLRCPRHRAEHGTFVEFNEEHRGIRVVIDGHHKFMVQLRAQQKFSEDQHISDLDLYTVPTP